MASKFLDPRNDFAFKKIADVKELTQQDPIIGQAFEALNQYSWSQEELDTCEQTLKKERDTKAILDQKKAEGIAEATLRIAQKLISSGMDLKQVKDITGLSSQELTKLSM